MHIDNFVSGYNKFRIISHGLINVLLYCSSFDFHAAFLIRQSQSGLKAPTIAYFEQNNIYSLFLEVKNKINFQDCLCLWSLKIVRLNLIWNTYFMYLFTYSNEKKKYFIILIPNISFKFYVIIKQRKA